MTQQITKRGYFDWVKVHETPPVIEKATIAAFWPNPAGGVTGGGDPTRRSRPDLACPLRTGPWDVDRSATHSEGAPCLRR